MEGSTNVEQVDVLLVGAGFASYTLLNRYISLHPFLHPRLIVFQGYEGKDTA